MVQVQIKERCCRCDKPISKKYVEIRLLEDLNKKIKKHFFFLCEGCGSTFTGKFEKWIKEEHYAIYRTKKKRRNLC